MASVNFLSLLVASLGPCLLSFGFIYWFRERFQGRGFIDTETTRSLHIGSIPKIGGLILLPSMCLGLGIEALLHTAYSDSSGMEINRFSYLACVIAPSFPIYFVCLLSDRSTKEISALVRFLIFLGASCVFTFFATEVLNGRIVQGIAAPMPGLGFLPASFTFFILAGLTTLSVLAMTNFFNFMDGMDGLAGSMGAIGFAAMALCSIAMPVQPQTLSSIGVAALLISASCLGFLFWNWPRAKVFMGDTGSTFLGFSAAGLGWLGSFDGLWHWSIPFLIFYPFWFDATVTLIRRLLRGEKVWRAHREHFYQRAVLSLHSLELRDRHIKVLIPCQGLMLISALSGLGQHFFWFGFGRAPAWAALTTLGILHGVIAYWVDARYRKFLDLTQAEVGIHQTQASNRTPRSGH